MKHDHKRSNSSAIVTWAMSAALSQEVKHDGSPNRFDGMYPIGKAHKGALNNTEGATMLGHAISSALARAKIEGGEAKDVLMGCAMQQGTTGTNIARRSLLRAGLPVTTAGF